MPSRSSGRIVPTRAEQARRLETRTSALRIETTEHLAKQYGSGRLPEGMDFRKDARPLTGEQTTELLDIVWELAGIVSDALNRQPERIGTKKEVVDGN